MNQPPWTEIGRLQQEIDLIKNELHRKGDSHEIYSLSSRLDSLEHSLWEIRSILDGIEPRLQACENPLSIF